MLGLMFPKFIQSGEVFGIFNRSQLLRSKSNSEDPREKGITRSHKGKGNTAHGQKGKGKGHKPYVLTAIPIHIQTPRVARTHETKRFPGSGGPSSGGLTAPNLRYTTCAWVVYLVGRTWHEHRPGTTPRASWSM